MLPEAIGHPKDRPSTLPNNYAVTYGQEQGAIEVKSAWIALPADGSRNYRYLTATATITDPFGHQSTSTMGLVGLHIKLDPYYGCAHNLLPGTPCDQNAQPQGRVPYTEPMQITRLFPVDSVANCTTLVVRSRELWEFRDCGAELKISSMLWNQAPIRG
jgi:hypothetical protein